MDRCFQHEKNKLDLQALNLRTSAVMFIGSIKGLNKHSAAREGNYMGRLASHSVRCQFLLFEAFKALYDSMIGRS